MAVVELVWQDESGSTSATTLSAPSSLDASLIASDAIALGAILASLTGCVLVKLRIKYINKPETIPAPAAATPITRTGIFFFSVDPPSPDGLISIPAIKDSIISDVEPFAGVAIDRDNPDVIAFADAVVSGGISNVFGDAFTALIAAYLQSRV